MNHERAPRQPLAGSSSGKLRVRSPKEESCSHLVHRLSWRPPPSRPARLPRFKLDTISIRCFLGVLVPVMDFPVRNWCAGYEPEKKVCGGVRSKVGRSLSPHAVQYQAIRAIFRRGEDDGSHACRTPHRRRNNNILRNGDSLCHAVPHAL